MLFSSFSHRLLLLVALLGLFWPLPLHAAGTSPEQLHAPWNALLTKYVSREGQVDYEGLLEDEDQLISYLQTIRKTPPDERLWSRNEQEAYWLNVYNAATVYMVLQYYPVASMNEIKIKTLAAGAKSAWEAPYVTVGARQYSLNQIEREVLRAKFQDPRVHFALVCAAETSPPLLNEAYSGQRLDQQLNEQGHRFLNSTRFNQVAADHVRLSSLFDWYSAEFGEGAQLLTWLNRYSDIKIAAAATVEFLPFSWALNDRARQTENQALRQR